MDLSQFIFLKIQACSQEPVLVGSRVSIQTSKWADSAHLHSPDDTTFRCPDDLSCPSHPYTSLPTKFPEFTVVVIYSSITVFNTCSYLLQ